ncbi:MAG: pantoate--beta-alanine ligase, partial [Proteobacteria bacterium]|nr:pantoate--beta-alanine ligase [Pseudomonadota bacterium]
VFGQKDVQQAFVLRRMARDLNMNVTVLVEPTVREPDGLAMSSRNRYLSPDERSRASFLSRALKVAERSLQAGERSAENLRRALAIEIEKASPTEIDYIAVLNPETFEPEDPIGSASVLVALAVRFGPTRLIDNSIIRLAENQKNSRPSGGS